MGTCNYRRNCCRIAGIAFAVVKYFTPSYLDNDFDDFDDDFDDDFYADDEVVEINTDNETK